jgi:hypothetical protein
MPPVCEGFTDSRQHIAKIKVKVEPPGFPEARGLTGRFTSQVAGLTMRGRAAAARLARERPGLPAMHPAERSIEWA